MAARVSPADPDVSGGEWKVRGPAQRIQGTDIQNLNTSEFFATIQDALDDADTQNGHVLEVQVTPHSEGLVTVGKSVTIQGAGGGATVLATTATGTSGDARGWFLVTVSGVTFTNLTLDGNGMVIWQAIRLKEGGTVTNCAFNDIRSLPAHYNGIGVSTFKNATVTGCTFTNIGRIGIIFFSTDVTAGVASGNTYTGKGAGDHLDYGIELGGGAVASLQNNTITNNTGVAVSDGSTSAAVIITTFFGAGTTGTLGGNFLNGCTGGIAAGFDAADASVIVASNNDLSGNASYGVQNTSSTTTVNASANWWGSNVAATVATDAGAAVDYTPWLDLGTDTSGATGFQGSFSTLHVDDDSPQVGATNRVQEGINLVTASTVNVLPGTYAGNILLNKSVTLLGAQAGVDACGRIAVESILTGTGVLLTLQAGSAGSILDGLTFSGGTRGIESTSGPITNLEIRNNRFVGFTSAGVFLNDVGIDVTVHQNLIDGTSKLGGGGLFHLDQDNFDGFHFTENCVENGVTGTGFFVDGNHNVGVSTARSPLFDGNLFDGNGTGANLGRFAFEFGTISDNTFSNNVFDGLQGGIQNSTITGNAFASNGRSGLALTGFGGAGDATRGAQNCTISNNTFTANFQEGLFFSSGQFPGTISTNVANDNDFVGNGTGGSFDGVFYGGGETIDVKCNWWGHLDGPDYPPTNPSPGDDLVATSALFAPWLDAPQPGGNCNQFGPNNVAPVGADCISTANPCDTVDVFFSRADPTSMRGYSVTFQLSPELMLCSTPAASVLKGPYLTGGAGPNGTVYQVVDNTGGSYTVDEAILGTPCGSTGSGVLFRVAVKNSGGDGVGTITVTSVLARDCNNVPLPGIPGAPLSVPIDNTPPVAVTNLSATQVKLGNDADGTTKITLAFTAPGDAAVVEVWRAGFGNYPEYDDAPGSGSVPATPAYPPPGPWVLTAVTATGQTDEVTARDFWYFVVFTKDACGNVSPVSNKTTGTLNYHLGDVHNGLLDCVGNNLVNTSDISFLGANYAITLVASDPLGCLDVGPTTDSFINGRPLTDNKVQFEDLILFAINFGEVSKAIATPVPAARDELWVQVPPVPAAGGTLEAEIRMSGAGRVQGLSVQLGWDASVVEPVGIEAGSWLESQGGVAFPPAAGGVDAALLGSRDVGLAGEGVLARVRFRVLSEGDPSIEIASVEARDALNRTVEVQLVVGTDPVTRVAPRVTALLPNVPNPFNPSTRIPFTLAEDGAVDLGVYTVSGRRVRTLARRDFAAGTHGVVWDGTDDAGLRMASGLYYVHLTTREVVRTRPIVLVK